MKRLRMVFTLLGGMLVLAAILQELRKPAEQRTWHGRVAGVVPYDFRPPTWQRVKESWWNPDSDRLLTDRVLGVGWAINLPVLFDRARAFAEA